jgi:hypothetical protein
VRRLFLACPLLVFCASLSAAEQPDLTKQPTLYVVGYAHLDTQWRWEYPRTIGEFIPKTMHDNFALFEKYPHYVFNFSGANRYRMMKEYYPADYAKVQQYVAAGRPVQECDRYERAKPRTDRREGDIDPVFRIADHGVGREQIPYAAPRRRRHAPARHHGRGEHDIHRIGCGGRKQDAPGGQGIDGSHCNSFHAIAFSSKVGTGLSEENASKQKLEPGSDAIRTEQALTQNFNV